MSAEIGPVAAPVAQAGSSPLRMAWIDVLRGIAVVLVIYYHAVVGLSVVKAEAPGWMLYINYGLAPLRMPTLMFLSGLLLPRSLEKSPKTYVLGKVRGIAWPWLVWTLITTAFWALGSRLLGDGVYTLDDALGVFFGARTYTWYLAYLMMYYLIALVVPARVRPWLAVVSLLASTVISDGEGLSRLTQLLGFFLLGELAARKNWIEWVRQFRWVPWVSLVVLAIMSVVSLNFPIRYTAFAAPGVFALVLCVVFAGGAMAHTLVGRLLSGAGRDSIVYYLTHWPIIALGAHAVRRAGVTNGALAVIILVALGFAVSAVAAWLRHRSSLVALLYAWPKPKPRV